MRQALTALIAIACLAVFDTASVQAQPQTASVGFTNKSDVNVIVTGYTIVNGNKRSGPPLQLKKSGGKAFEPNVPGGIRVYTILDANTFRPIGTGQVPIRADTLLDIVPNRTNPGLLMIVPAGPGGFGPPQ